MKLTEKIKRQFHTDDPQQLKRELAWLAARVRAQRGNILAVGTLGIIGTVMGLVSSIASKYLIDSVTGYGKELLGKAAALMVIMLLGSLIFQAVSSRISAKIHVRVKNEMQHGVYARILRAGWESLEPYRSGDLLNRLNNDVNVVSDGTINFLPSLAASGARFLGAFGIMVYYDPTMALIALMGVPVMLIMSRTLMRRMRRHNLQMKELGAEVVAFQEDSFRNLTSIKAFALAEDFETRMHRIQGTYMDAYLDHNAFQIRMHSFLSLTGMGVTASCFGWGVYQLWSGNITFGSMMLFLQLADVLRGSFSGLVSLAQQLISLTTSAGRIMVVEALPAENDGCPEGLSEEKHLDLCLRQVSFCYHSGEPVLEHFDFTADYGELIAITGPSGEGKTTLLRLLLGLVKPTSGTMTIRGGSGREYEICAGSREIFAYVPQGNSIFSGTVAENLRLVKPDATDAELEAVLKTACAWEFVCRFPEGIHHYLGAGGRGISEGQAQRLAIARALLRRAPVLLLDEATSGLDLQTERNLLENLRGSGMLRTCILVTHRPESARFCSRAYEICRRQVTEVTDGT